MRPHKMQQSKEPRRTDLLGVHSLDHFCIAVPDLALAQTYYGTFGLKATPQDGGLALSASERPHRWGRLVEGPRKQLQYLSFGAFANDMPRFAARLKQLGVQRLDPPPGLDPESIWLRSPQGHLVE